MKITYVTNLNPATAISSVLRIRGIAEALELAGMDVTVLVPSVDPALPDATWPGQWLHYGHANLTHSPTRQGIRNLILDGAARQAIDDADGHALLVYGTSAGLLRAAIGHGRRHDIPVILDVVEWYEGAHMRGGRFGPWAIANEDSMRRLSKKADRVISISSYLSRYYRAGALETLVIPPLFPRSIRNYARVGPDTDGRLNLCFAGSIGGKDARSFVNTVIALSEIDPRGQASRLHVVGPTRRELQTAIGPSLSLPSSIVIHGRLPHEDALAVVARCHFTVLQRPNAARYANAGFPSKAAESLVLGTPVISNLTSDLGQYLVDGCNAIVLPGDTVGDMVEGLRRALSEPPAWARERIQSNADSAFNPESHAAELAEFVARPKR